MTIRAFAFLAISVSLFACNGAAPALHPSTPTTDETCAVWAREVEFARSVHDHDARAFAEHVHPNAVFVGGESPLRGRDAIALGWKELIQGEDLRLEWQPTSVVLTGDLRVALVRGPYWMEATKPDATPRFRTGVFQSVWVKDTDGAWRVTIDGGTPPPIAATEADIEKLKASRPSRCPLAQ